MKMKIQCLKPSIDPGNQLCNGICADLAIAPLNNNIPIISIAVLFINGAKLNNVE